MNAVGIDIGGANLKTAHVDGRTLTRSFQIWKSPDQLPEALSELLAEFPEIDVLAVTMTAELADCFESKAAGVDFILRAVEQVAGTTPISVWQTGAEFVTPEVAREIPLLVAAANWHALATWVGRMVPESAAILIDVGSTTTDIIPLLDGVPVPRRLTDVERLQSGELVYSGVRRTPLCAIARSVPFREGSCPLAAEVFATSLDVYLTLGSIAKNSNDRDTANGRPATVACAHDRLARMLCCDSSEFTAQDAEIMADFLANVQKQQITGALNRVLANLTEHCECKHVLISGSGAFLAERIVREHSKLKSAKLISLAETFDDDLSLAACAMAVARLGSERLTGLA